MCRVLVSGDEFKAILTPFSEVIRNRCSSQLLPIIRILEGGSAKVSINFTKRRQNGFKLGTRDKYATPLRQEDFISNQRFSHACAIRRRKKDGGCTFYHNTLRTKLSPRRHMERFGLMAVVPTLTALLLTSLNDLQFFIVFIRSFRVFAHSALQVIVPVAIFFLKVDCTRFYATAIWKNC